MKKKVGIILCTLALLFCIAGCTQTTTVKTTKPKVNYSDLLVEGEEVKVMIWYAWGHDKQEAQNEIITSFVDMMEELYGVIVTFEGKSFSNYDTLKKNVDLAISGSDSKTILPNIVHGYPDHFASYLDQNALVCIDDYINDETFGIDLNEFIPGFLEENNQFDGVYYSLPYAKSTEIMIYNKAALDKEGVTIPYDEALTWNEVAAIWDSYKANNTETTFSYMCGYDSSSNLFINFSRQLKCPYTRAISEEEGELLVNNDDTREMLEYLKSEVVKGHLVVPKNISSDASYCSDWFKEQKIMFTIGSTAGFTYNINSDKPFELGVAPVPQFEYCLDDETPAHNSVVQQGPDIGIIDSGDDLQNLVSWMFLKYSTTQDLWDTDSNKFIEGHSANAQLAMDTNYFPVTIRARDSENYQNFLNIAEKYINGETLDLEEETLKYFALVAYVALEYEVDWFEYDPAFCNSSTTFSSSAIRTNAGELIDDLFKTPTTSVDALLRTMVERSTI